MAHSRPVGAVPVLRAVLVVGALATVVVTGAQMPAGAVDDTGAVQVSGIYRPVVGDFNGDGFGDIFWYRPGPGSDPIWFGNIRGWSARTTGTAQIYGNYRLAVGDYNGDGIDDLLLHRPAQSSDVLWSFDEQGGHSAANVPGGPPAEPLVGHFNGDERDDILWYGPGTAPDSIWVATGTSFRKTPLSVNGLYRPAVGDFDGNGSDDVLWGHDAGSQPLWLATGALGTACQECFTKTSRVFAGSGSSALPADVDGDGRTDVVWYGAGPGADALWRATGGGVFAQSALSINGTYRPVVREAFNQDQIVWYNAGGADLQWYYDSAAGQFIREDFPLIGAGRIPLVGLHRGPFPDEDIFFYGPGSIVDVQTYVEDSTPQRVRS